jgi:membrane-associated phospholipid phosphatase
VGLVVLVSLASVDRTLASWLIGHRWDALVVFQHHTLFEDGVFGGSDFGLFFQIGCGVIAFFGFWIFRFLRRFKATRWSAEGQLQIRRFCLFVTLSSIYSGVFLVQGIKFAWGRARPHLVFGPSPELYTDWYAMGVLSITDGRYPGSFPSGHVASASAFIGLVYLFGPRPKGLRRLAVVLVIVFCFLSWLAMSVARVMGRDHWPTDCIAAGVLTMLSYAVFAELILFQQSEPGRLLSLGAQRAVVRLFVWSLGLVLLVWGVRETLLLFG